MTATSCSPVEELFEHEALEGGVLDDDEPRIGGAANSASPTSRASAVGLGRRGREVLAASGCVDAAEQVDLVAEDSTRSTLASPLTDGNVAPPLPL